MSLMYNSTNKIKFTSISEKYNFPDKAFKAMISKAHSELITYTCAHFKNTKKYKQQVVDALNTITYCIVDNRYVPCCDWDKTNPFDTMPKDISKAEVERVVGNILLTVEGIDWDITPTSDADVNIPDIDVMPEQKPTPTVASEIVHPEPVKIEQLVPVVVTTSAIKETQKEDLYILPPKNPQFDVEKPWLTQQDGPDKLIIYTTLPEVPAKQCDISITTNVNMLTDAELVALYPTKFFHTRAPILYEPVEGLDFDEELGVIIPIAGYTREELLDNIIRYPHFFQLKRLLSLDAEPKSFYMQIEIDGILYPIEEVWDSLPEAKIIPRQSEYIKEYIVRRYILECERGVPHNYKMFGTLDQFLTLIMPMEGYVKRGYTDTVGIARQCVNSRVSFLRSRNPILRRLGLNV